MLSRTAINGSRAVILAFALTGAGNAFAQNKTHPLIGKIYSAAEGQIIAEGALKRAVENAQFVLLGEIHNNPKHHSLQARYVNIAAKAGGKPDVVFEMLSPDMNPVLSRWLRDANGKTQGLGVALKWKKRGWGSFADYAPIFQTAWRNGLSIRGGNLARKRVREIAFKGKAALSVKDRKAFFVGRKMSAQQNDFLLSLLFDSHCKLMPKRALSGMALAQRVRDGAMARAMLEARSRAILISGAGHARLDIGVPRLLRAARPKAKIVSIAFIEVEPDALKPAKYLPRTPDNRPVFDFLYFTEKAVQEDHCAALKKRFEQHRRKPNGK